MKHVLREAFWYGIASGIAMVTDIGLLLLLVEVLGWHYLPAATMAFVVGTIVVYSLSVSAIFKFRRFDNRKVEFGIFAFIGMLGVLVNLGVLSIAVEVLGQHYLAGKFLSVIFTFTLNFSLRRIFLFSAQIPLRSGGMQAHGSPTDD